MEVEDIQGLGCQLDFIALRMVHLFESVVSGTQLASRLRSWP